MALYNQMANNQARVIDGGAALTRTIANRQAARAMGITGGRVQPFNTQPGQVSGDQGDPTAYNANADYGVDGAAGPYIDARWGGIPGRVVRNKSVSQTITSQDVNPLLDQTVAFSQADQTILGSSGRRLVGVICSAYVVGTLPSGYDADSLRKVIESVTYLQVLQNGQIMDMTPITLARDTGFTDRLLRLNIALDPGNFASTSLNFTSQDDVLPVPASSSYAIKIVAQCAFAPLSRQQRNAMAAAFGQP